MTEENSDRLRKMRNRFEILNKRVSKFYSPSELLAVDGVTVLFKGRVIFPIIHTQETQKFGIKIYKTYDETVLHV
jgi:hypothetical protein